MRASSSLSLVLVSFLCVSLLVTACRPGTYVDKNTRDSFVDSGSAGGFDKESPSAPSAQASQPVIVHEGEKGFVPPPASTNYVQNSTVSLEEKMAFVGRDAVKVWVWNERGAQAILIPEFGSVPALGTTIAVQNITAGTDNRGLVTFALNGIVASPVAYRSEVHLGTTYVFVSDVFLNAKN